MEVLKIATAGSVDDGKSTLIGRLLYDTKSLTDDKLEAIEKSSKQKGFDYLDFSFATDGLVAEREQGITIDVAHIYFSTEQRSYIIADTPGHIEYTRNMVTGASTSQASIILIDARKGVIEQTIRHFFINNLLKVKNVIVAVNKMDLVNFSEEVFANIQKDVLKLADRSEYKSQIITFIPVSALHGDNVVELSENMKWYNGLSLLNFLENIKIGDVDESSQFRLPVQTVIRPKSENFHDYRGYAGKVYGNSISVGDEVTILPSNQTSKIKSLEFYEDTFDKVEIGNAVTVRLADDVNVSRGDMIVKTNELPTVSKQIKATVCWMENKPLLTGSKFILKHAVNDVLAKIDSVESVLEINVSNQLIPSNNLNINDIGIVNLKLAKPIYFDKYYENKANGSFILIDSKTNNTVAVGFLN